MKKVIIILITFALILSLSAAAFADDHYTIDGDTIVIRDDGTGQAYPNFIFYSPIGAVVAENSSLRLSLDFVRILEIKAFSDIVASTYEATLGDEFCVVSIGVSIENIGHTDFTLDPAAALIVTSEKEQVTCLSSLTSKFDTFWLGGAEQSGTLVFKCTRSSADELTSIRLHFPAGKDASGANTGEALDISIVLDKKYQEPEDPALTHEQQIAAWFARNTLRSSYSSRQRMIDLLVRNGYAERDATAAIEYWNIDWNEQAVKQAQGYLRHMAGTADLRPQLEALMESAGFTADEIAFALDYLYIR